MMSLSIISRKNSKFLINSYHAFQGLVPLSFSISFLATFHITHLNPGKKLTDFDHLLFTRHSLKNFISFLPLQIFPSKPPLQSFEIHLSRANSQVIPLWCLRVSFFFPPPLLQVIELNCSFPVFTQHFINKSIIAPVSLNSTLLHLELNCDSGLISKYL